MACANCSTSGTLGFTGERFAVDNGYITGGVIEMEANGFGGLFELNITSGQLKDSFSHTIFSFPIAGIGVSISLRVDSFSRSFIADVGTDIVSFREFLGHRRAFYLR